MHFVGIQETVHIRGLTVHHTENTISTLLIMDSTYTSTVLGVYDKPQLHLDDKFYATN